MAEEHEITYMNQKFKLSTIALLVIMAGVVLPAAMYSINLKDPSPSELLVAICISLFSGVVFLWVLDATSVLRFRSEWIAKSVYGAAISSVLGTSAAVYNDAFTERKYQYEGLWEVTIKNGENNKLLADHDVILHYSNSSNTYFGYSALRTKKDNTEYYDWLEIMDFRPSDSLLTVRLKNVDGAESVYDFDVKRLREGKRFEQDGRNNSKIDIKLTRPK